MGFTVGKGSEKGSQKGSEKGVSRRCLVCPLGEYAPSGVRPTKNLAIAEKLLRFQSAKSQVSLQRSQNNRQNKFAE